MKKMIREQLKKDNKGFSLAELIVVVLILGILAVAVTPQIMNWVNKSKVAKDESYAGTVSSAVESVALEWLGRGNLPASGDQKDASVTTNEVMRYRYEIETNASGTVVLSDVGGTAPINGDPSYSDTSTSPATTVTMSSEITDMIGATKLAVPTQSGMTQYQIDIVVTDGKTIEVTTTPIA